MSGWGGTLTAGGGSGEGATVSNYSPADGSGITPATPIQFDVTGAETVALVVTVRYPDTGASETVYDRDGWGVNFGTTGAFLGSERQPIENGYHFIIRRRGGWPFSPQIKVQGGTVEGGAVTQ